MVSFFPEENIMELLNVQKKKLWNDHVICIPKTNSCISLHMQISLQLKDSSC